MKQGYTHIESLIDESGSMQFILMDTIGGVNSFIKSQKEAPGEATYTLTKFDTANAHNVVQEFVNIKEAKELSTLNFTPRGGTPLYDAIGAAIIKLGIRLGHMREQDRPEKIIFAITTDGEENSSKEYKREQIKSMIEHQTNIYKWEFVFLAANQDAMKIGTGIGISALNSMTYSATGKGVAASFDALLTNTSLYRSGASSTMAFSDTQRTASMDVDVQNMVTASPTP
jgi:hypothetical protein